MNKPPRIPRWVWVALKQHLDMSKGVDLLTRIPRWVWVALKQHLDMSKGVDLLIQEQLQPGSVLGVVINGSLTILFVWLGSIFGLTVLSWGLTVSNEVVKKVRYFIIRIPKILFWLVAELAKLITKFF